MILYNTQLGPNSILVVISSNFLVPKNNFIVKLKVEIFCSFFYLHDDFLILNNSIDIQ